MSTTFHIYKPVNGVEYTGTWLDQFSLKEIDQAIIENNDYILKGPGKEVEDESYCWSDRKKHVIFDIFEYQSGFDRKLERRMVKKMKRTDLDFHCGLKNKGQPYKVIPVEEIAYSQGWFVRRRFLEKKNPMYIAVTKEEMMRFFRKYGTIPKKEQVIGYTCGGYIGRITNDLRLIDTMNRFEELFEPGCIFVARY